MTKVKDFNTSDKLLEYINDTALLIRIINIETILKVGYEYSNFGPDSPSHLNTKVDKYRVWYEE